MFSLIKLPNQNEVDTRSAEMQVPFSMAIEIVEFMHDCCPEHQYMGITKLK